MIPQGRHRYYQLARPEIAEMLEAIQRVAPRRPVRSLRQSEESRVLCRARTCYDHLAGKLGVGMTQALCERELLRYEGRQFYLTERGAAWCEGIGLDWRPGEKTEARVCGALPGLERAPRPPCGGIGRGHRKLLLRAGLAAAGEIIQGGGCHDGGPRCVHPLLWR